MWSTLSNLRASLSTRRAATPPPKKERSHPYSRRLRKSTSTISYAAVVDTKQRSPSHQRRAGNGCYSPLSVDDEIQLFRFCKARGADYNVWGKAFWKNVSNDLEDYRAGLKFGTQSCRRSVMSRVEQRKLEISKNGEDYEATSAFNTALDAFVKVVEVEEAHLLDNAPNQLRTPDFNVEDHPDSHIDGDENYAADKYHQDGNEVEKKINDEKSKNGADYEATSAFNTALDAFVKVVEAEEAHVLDNAPNQLRTPDFNVEDHPDSHIDGDEDYAADEYHEDGNEVEKKINDEKIKTGADYEATSAFNTALDAFVKVVEAKEAHVLNNASNQLRTPDFNVEDHPDSHYAADKYHQDGNEFEKKIYDEKSFPKESEEWIRKSDVEEWIRKSDVEASIQKMEHHLSAINAEYIKLKAMTM